MAASEGWSIDSWKKFPVKQQPKYADQETLNTALNKIKRLPPLVAVHEIESLQQALAECAQGKKFLLQGGDCAERFDDCDAKTIENKMKILLQMSLVITFGSRTPTVRIGRLAGQYGKPRSSDTEMIDGVEYPSYRGDNINGHEKENRTPDPNRLVEGYFHSAATINYARVVIAEGLADLRRASAWDMGFVKNQKRRDEYMKIAKHIMSAMDFIETCGVALDPVLKSVDMFTSHEGLHLDYESAMTTKGSDGKYYNTGTHFLWIGDRTRQLDHAHVEYFRGISNPIGIKVGPTSKPDELVKLIKTVWPNPQESPGRVTLITRFGAGKVKQFLPPLLEAVKEANLPVVWITDPCHGNTQTVSSGHKTRSFDDVLKEVEECIDVHSAHGTILGGVHFELTGDNVTECIGGSEELNENDLPLQYNTLCDPRLNYSQSLEMAFRITDYLAASRPRASSIDLMDVGDGNDKNGQRNNKRQRV